MSIRSYQSEVGEARRRQVGIRHGCGGLLGPRDAFSLAKDPWRATRRVSGPPSKEGADRATSVSACVATQMMCSSEHEWVCAFECKWVRIFATRSGTCVRMRMGMHVRNTGGYVYS
jgi:hypothetical protein